MTACQNRLISLGIPYAADISFADICSMRCGGTAPLLAYPQDGASCHALLRAWDKEGIPYRVIGSMTNTLPPDGTLSYPLISTRFLQQLHETEDTVCVGAGVPVSALAKKMLRRGRDAAAMLHTIPGTIGGAVRGNAGAFGHDISEYLLSCEVYSPKDGHVHTCQACDMAFAYRDSRLKYTEEILLAATLRADVCDTAIVKEQQDAAAARRRQTQPNEPSLGSVFLHTQDGSSAAAYIDAAGLKGMRIGGAQVSRRHAGFIVNGGGATSSDVYALIQYIQRKVAQLFGIHLRCEICILPKEA